MNIENMTLGQMAKLANEVREEKRALEKMAKSLGADFDALKEVIYAKLEEQGVDRTSVDGISLSKSDTQQPTVTDWDAVYAYIKENDLFALLQRRVTATLWKEILDSGEQVPGIDSFWKKDVNIRVS